MFSEFFWDFNNLFSLPGLGLAVVLILACLAWCFPDTTPSSKNSEASQNKNQTLLNIWKQKYLPWKKPKSLPLGTILIEVAGRLDAGADPATAWKNTLLRYQKKLSDWPPGQVPVKLLWQDLQSQLVPADRSAFRGVLVAIKFAQQVGAPLAEVLRSVANTINDAAEAYEQRKIIMTAPKATARLLSLLPLAGLGLGEALGMHPTSTLTDGGLGSMAGLLGVLIMCIGYWWMHKLIEVASR